MTSSQSQSTTNRLRLLTLNCWGLKYVSKYRTERIAAIADFLAGSEYDLVALQELWVFTDYELVRFAVSKHLPHSKFFYSGALGAGLVLFSRFPIIAATVQPYSVNGSPIDVLAGDWFVGKAAASIIVVHPILGHLEVFNTHLFAKGGDEGPDQQKAHRLVNAWEFAKLARQASELGRYVIAAGDFNSVPTAPPMEIIREHASLSDAWVDTHPSVRPPSVTGIPTPIDAIHIYGVTADSPLNSYSAGKSLESNARKYQGKRLDYVFYRGPSRSPSSTPTLRLKAVDTQVLLTERIPGHNYSFSDHFALEATFEIVSDAPFDVGVQSAPTADQGPSSTDVAPVPNLLSIPSKSLSADLISSTIQSLTARYRYAQSQSRLHLTIFSVSLFLLIAIIVGSAWLPRAWINPIFLIVTIFLAWLATTMLYIGFIYGNWEINALTNTIEELEIHRNNLEDRSRTNFRLML